MMNESPMKPYDEALELTISCEGIKRPNSSSGPDSFVVIYTRETELDDWECIGYTEAVPCSFVPRFQRTFTVPFVFASRQMFLFRVHDFDFVSDPADIDNHALLGSCQADLSTLLKGNAGSARLLMDTAGFVLVGVKPHLTQELKEMANFVSLVVSAQQLRSLSHMGSCDPRMVVSRLNMRSGSKVLLHKSEVIRNCLVPTWQRFSISFESLGVGLPDEESLFIEIFDSDACGDSLIGSTTLSVRGLQGSQKDVPIHGNDGRVNGALRIYSQMTHVPTFLEQIQLGFRLDTIFVFDFADHASVRDPHYQHHLQSVAPSAFIKVVTSVGQHIRNYLAQSRMRALGCGLVNAEDMRTPIDVLPFLCDSSSQNTGLLSCLSNETYNEVRQLLRDYQYTLPRVSRAKCTRLAPVIRSVTSLSRASVRIFTLVPILTYGEIDDLDEVIEAILDADLDPVAFLFIDLGTSGTLSDLFRRDGECIHLTSRKDGRVLRRQMVSCVSYRLHSHSMSQLTTEVMKQVPRMCSQWGIHTGALTPAQS